ncbi:uncharacterized protein [Diabrotica undecimpunctata]|uniref:uncharacterized protein n=1 Tax=Diabrotica undecimpunctata TaxID=50387 RepID=UPI003B63668C
MDITAIQEINWTATGIRKMEDTIVFWSGSENRHEYGYGFVIAKILKSAVIDFKPINERICYIRLKGKWFNLTIFSIYAPTEDAEEDRKDEFYELLDQKYKAAPKHDVKIVMGDCNAKSDKEDYLRKVIVAVSNRFQLLGEEEHNVELKQAWQQVASVIEQAAKETIGKKRTSPKRKWFDKACKQILEIKMKKRLKMLQGFTDENKADLNRTRAQTRRLFRTKKRSYLEEQIREMDRSGERNQIRKFFSELPSVRKGASVGVTQPKRNEAGELIMIETEIVERWKKYVRNLLNIESETEEADITFHSADIEIPAPTLEEVKNAIASLKDHKAPENDDINGELLKKGGNLLHQKLYDIILRERLQRLWAEFGSISDDNKSFIDSKSEKAQTALESQETIILEEGAQGETAHKWEDSEEVEAEDESKFSSGSESGSENNCKRYFLDKDKSKWFKLPKNKQVKTRSDNLITYLPSVKGIAREKQSVLDCWLLFFTERKYDTVDYTNVKLATKAPRYDA